MCFTTEIQRTFTGSGALLRPNLIIVGSSVITQWKDAIDNFTNLKVLMVSDYYSTITFQKILDAGKINTYDIVLLKNGIIAGNLNILGTDSNHKCLISIIESLTRNKCWSRVIYDDFDTINIPADACAINALFTIYVSSTTKKSGNKYIKQESTQLVDILSKPHINLAKVITDPVLFTNFNLHNNIKYTEASIGITIMECFKYVYNNPDDNCIRLLGVMSGEEANNIMEMLNSDAVGTAADTLGIKSTSVLDIFQHILAKKYQSYEDSKIIVATAEKFKNVVLATAPEHNLRKQHSTKRIDEITKIIKKKMLPTPEQCKYTSAALFTAIVDIINTYTALRDEYGLAIQRVIDNVKEGECQICRLPLQESGVFIIRCCGLILCDYCCIRGNNFAKGRNGNTAGIYGSCANCKSCIDFSKDLVFLDPEFDIESILKENDKSVEVIEYDGTPIADQRVEVTNPKLKALLTICTGGTPENGIPHENKLKQLLKGRISIPQPVDIVKKIIVFANYNETLTNIEKMLVEHNIKFIKLGGTYKEKARTIQAFKDDGRVLLINSMQNCAGLNIQFCTDIVIFHRINDKNITGQVIGRGQRLGRTHNLKLHYLLYDNESIVL